MAKVKRSLDDTEEISKSELEKIQEEYSSDRSKIINWIIGGVIVILFIILVFIGYLLLSSSNKIDISSSSEEKVVETATPNVEESQSSSIVLSQYREQAIHTKIINLLDKKYGTDGYTKPSTEQYTISGTENNPIVKFDLTVGGMNEENRTVPCKFTFSWDNSKQVFELQNYMIDEENSESSDFESHSDEEDIKKKAEESEIKGTEVSNYNIKVNSSISVNITSTGSGNVTAYAISSDGTKTELGTANNNTISNTTSLPSGDYNLVLYVEDGVGYKWSYQIG